MAFEPFESSRWKVLRSRNHINEIQGETQRWANAKGLNQEPGKLWTNIPLAIGDAIHNLRSALDHLACDVVRLNNRSTKDVYFPFATSPDALDEQIKKRNFDRAAHEAIQLLREQEPWRGGKLALRAVHDMDVKDKHELILPVMTVTSREVVRGVPFILPGSECFNCGTPLEQVPYARAGTPVMLGHIFFADDETNPLARKEVVPTLTSLANTIDGVRKAFKTLLLP